MIGKNSTIRKRATAPNIFRNPLRQERDSEDLQEKIQKKAYELYEKRGRTDGDDLADWFEAEKLVKSGRR